MAVRVDGSIRAFRFRPIAPFLLIAEDFPAEIFGLCVGRSTACVSISASFLWLLSFDEERK
jgi:hypothetical protein